VDINQQAAAALGEFCIFCRTSGAFGLRILKYRKLLKAEADCNVFMQLSQIAASFMSSLPRIAFFFFETSLCYGRLIFRFPGAPGPIACHPAGAEVIHLGGRGPMFGAREEARLHELFTKVRLAIFTKGFHL
jgi:hypothetical protein